MDARTEIEAPIGEAAEALAKRITTERERLATEEQIEASLTVERKRLLTEGSDTETDQCEQRIDASRSAQVRILERLDLLAAQLHEANAAARGAELDAIAARANRLREHGEHLIRQVYAKQAQALAVTMRALMVCDGGIERANRELERGGREPVASSNDVRCRAGQTVRWREKQRIGVGDPRHPNHHEVTHRSSNGEVAYLEGGGSCPAFTELEVECEERIPYDHIQPLYEEVTLPRSESVPLIHKSLPAVVVPASYYTPRPYAHTEVEPEEIDRLVAELEATEGKTKRKGS